MRFLDTNNTQPNSEIVYTLVQSMLPNNLTMGLLCLAGGLSYYSWNYYKNKNKDLNTATDQKNGYIENKLSQIKNENNSDNIAKPITNNENDSKEVAQEDKKLDTNNIKDTSDMLDEDIETEFVIVNNNHYTAIPFEFINKINSDDEWEMVHTPSNLTNTI